MQTLFGAGLVWSTQLTLGSGAAAANPTPLLFGVLQGVDLDISREVKSLHGQYTFPVDVAAGKGKMSGKARVGEFRHALFNAAFFGASAVSGILAVNADTVGSTIPATPFQVTVTPPSSGTFENDLGVIEASGKVYERVASAPATGQYSVSAGVYTFAAADTGKLVYINYSYTATSTTSKKTVVTNTLMGQCPTFRLDFYSTRNGKPFFYRLASCVSTKLSISTKLDDFSLPEMDFEAFADAGGNCITIANAE